MQNATILSTQEIDIPVVDLRVNARSRPKSAKRLLLDALDQAQEQADESINNRMVAHDR